MVEYILFFTQEVFILDVIKYIVIGLHIVFAISIIVIVLLQSGKSAGLSGAIAGGAESFFGKNKGRTLDAMLTKYTTVAAIAFLVTSIVLQFMVGK